MIFTREDILKIQNALLQLGRKDSEFKDANVPLNSDDEIAILQDGINKKVSINNLLSTLGLLKKDDFINVSDRYDEYYIQLFEAINIIANNKRKKGLVITFQDLQGSWKIYQFKGELNNFVNINYWTDLFDYKYSIINSILPDEEDLTLTYPDANNNNFIKFKDKDYAPYIFSGKGYKILRKNIVNEKNILTQEMINKENTIYEIKYDFDLNSNNIILPNNSILYFNGGKLLNGQLQGNKSSIIASLYKILDNIKIQGTWNIKELYPEWFGAIPNSNIDCTNELQYCIDLLDYIYGGNLILSQGKYICNGITLKYKTNLIGSGKGATVLKKSDNSATPIITINEQSFCSSIYNLTIEGNNKISDGIYIKRTTTLERIEYLYDGTRAFDQKSAGGYYTGTIENISIHKCDTALNANNVTFNLYVNNCMFHDSNVGVVFAVTDSQISNCYVNNNYKQGMIISGSNNKISNCKAIFNNTSFTELDNTMYGVLITGHRNTIIGIETQDNYCGGFYIGGVSNIIIGCLSNTDGYGINNGVKVYNENINPYGFFIANRSNMIKSCTVCNYNAKHGTIIKSPIKLNDDILDYQDFDIKVSITSSFLFSSEVSRGYNTYPYNKGMELVQGYKVSNISNYYPNYEDNQFKYLCSDSNNININISKLDNNFTIFGSLIYNESLVAPRCFVIKELNLEAVFVKSTSNYNRIEFLYNNSSIGYVLIQKLSNGSKINFIIEISYVNDRYRLKSHVFNIPNIFIYNDIGELQSSILYTTTTLTITTQKVKINTVSLPYGNVALTSKIFEIAIIPGTIDIDYLYPNLYKGKIINKALVYLNANNYDTIDSTIGDTASRPTLRSTNEGFQYYDTTLHKPIWWNGTQWIDGTNTPV